MRELPTESAFVCEKCSEAHELKYGTKAIWCAFQSFDNEYCSELEKIIDLMEGRLMQKLIIKGRLPGRNEAENAARTHWAVGAKIKKENTERVAWEAIRQHIKPCIGTTTVEATFYEKDNRRDADNIISGLKYILDGLVNAGVLVNDTRKFVTIENLSIKLDKENPRVEVELYESCID